MVSIIKGGILVGDKIVGDITVVRKKENHRLMEVKLEHKVEGASQFAQRSPQREDFFHIE